MSQMCKVMTPLKEEKGTRRDVVGGVVVCLQSYCSTDDAAFLFPIKCLHYVKSSISSDCVIVTNPEQQNQSQLESNSMVEPQPYVQHCNTSTSSVYGDKFTIYMRL